jgi:hypothetical protein
MVGTRAVKRTVEQSGRNIARVAQSVEHTLGKGEVTGSIPVASLMAVVTAVRAEHVVMWDHQNGKSRVHTDESE